MADFVTDAYTLYGTHVGLSRAVPDLRDGLKPAQRRLVWSASEMGLKADGGYRKAVSVAAFCLGTYHPVGDKSIGQALVGLANLPTPLIQGMGSWGLPALDVPAAAGRYIECRLSAAGQSLMLSAYHLAATPMLPNFDGSQLEPLVLPARLPMLLVNGSSGIAVGITNVVPAFDAASVAKVIAAVLSKSKPIATAEDCKGLKLHSQYGGKLLSTAADLKPLWEGTKPVSINWQCDYSIDAKAKKITITGLPPNWPYTSRFDAMCKSPDVRSVKNISSGKDIRIEVTFKPEASIPAFEKKFLRSRVTTRINLVTCERVVTESGIVEAKARMLNVSICGVINEWIAWRVDLEAKAAAVEHAKLAAKLSREQAMLLAAKHIDEVVVLLRSKTVKNKVKALAKLLNISEVDAEHVWATPLRRFDRLSEAEQVRKVADLKSAMKVQRDIQRKPAASVAADLVRITAVMQPVNKVERKKKARS